MIEQNAPGYNISFEEAKEFMIGAGKHRGYFFKVFPNTYMMFESTAKFIIEDTEKAMSGEIDKVMDLDRLGHLVSTLKIIRQKLLIEPLNKSEEWGIGVFLVSATNWLNLFQREISETTYGKASAFLEECKNYLEEKYTLRDLLKTLKVVQHEIHRLLSYRPGIMNVSEMYLETLRDFFDGRDKDEAYSFRELKGFYQNREGKPPKQRINTGPQHKKSLKDLEADAQEAEKNRSSANNS